MQDAPAAILVTLCLSFSAVEAAKLHEQPCWTGLDPASATVLDCSNSGITGTIPQDLATSFPLLEEVRLQHNVLTGTLSARSLVLPRGSWLSSAFLHIFNDLLRALPSIYLLLSPLVP